MESKTFTGDVPKISDQKSVIDYDWSILIEKFQFGLPEDFDPKKTYGLFVYMSPDDSPRIPNDWLPVLAKHNLLLIAPTQVGNEQDIERRMGLGVLATVLTKRDYKIDPTRVYAAGLSGGARTANSIVFLHPELFTGALMNCGAGFPTPVAAKHRNMNDPKQADYGQIFGQEYADPDVVKKSVRFAFTTGKGDFRYANILDLFEGGYKPNGYQAKLFDVPGMGHSDCDAKTLDEALRFLDPTSKG